MLLLSSSQQVYFITRISRYFSSPARFSHQRQQQYKQEEHDRLLEDLDQSLLDERVLAALLKRCGEARILREGRFLHAHILKSPLNSSSSRRFLSNWLVQMYGDCGSLEEAQAVFDTLPNPNLHSWTVLIKAYTKNGRGRKALECYDLLRLRGLKPNLVTFVCAVDACASIADLEKGKEIYGAIVDSGCEGYLNIGTALVNMYSRCGSFPDAKAVFDRMPEKDVVCWNAMICAYVRDGKALEALNCFYQMRINGLMPSPVSFVCALDACAALTSLEKGKEFHALSVELEFEAHVLVATALINMYGKCGSVEDARNVFDRMHSRNLVSWNAMIAVYTQNGRGNEALYLYHQMQCEGFKPDQITFVSVLSACSHTGGVRDSRSYFRSMVEEYDITPMLEHCVCLIDSLGRAGKLDEAEGLIEHMPYSTEIQLWLCLLSACRIHGDIDRSIRIANRILELNPKIAAL